MAAKKAVKKGAKAAKSSAAAAMSTKPAKTRAASPTSAKTRSKSDKAGKAWTLRLYIAGDSPRSRNALTNLTKLCEASLKDNYEIEVIDLTKRPDLAKADQILAVPTLIRKIPEPMKRVIGDLSNADRALVALDLEAAVTAASDGG
jgi:circadian clock protein KaiB